MLTDLEGEQFHPLQGRVEGLLRRLIHAQTFGAQSASPALVEDLECAVAEVRALVASGPVDCVDLFGPLPESLVEGGRPLCPVCRMVVPPVEPDSSVYFHPRGSSPGMWRASVSRERYADDSLGLVPAHWHCGELFLDFVFFSSRSLEVQARLGSGGLSC